MKARTFSRFAGYLSFAIALLVPSLLSMAASGPAPSHLKCEFLSEPLGIDTAPPRLSWQIDDARTGAKQTAYRIQAATSQKKLEAGEADLWDSGVVASEQSHLVAYAGKPPTSRQRIFWRVKTWDENGLASGWSAPTWFEEALSNSGDWKASWITAPEFDPVQDATTALWSRMAVIPTMTNPQLANVDNVTKQELQSDWVKKLAEIRPAPLFRKSFSLPEKIKSARLYLSGLGFHEVTINGRRVDDFMMAPAESEYPEYANYVVRDVTDFLQEGENVIGVMLGNGRYNEKLTYSQKAYGEDLPLIAQLEAETDRGRVSVVSDETWLCAPSPLLKNHFWVSEAWDARREMPGWNAPGFDASAWKPARAIPAPTKNLVVQTVPQERVVRRIRPVSVTNPREGVWVFDMGELIVGCAELDVRVPAGTALTMRYGEQLFGHKEKYTAGLDGSLLHYDGFENTAPVPGMLSSKMRGNGVMNFGAKNHPAFHALTPADVYVARGSRKGETWHARFAYHPFRFVELTGYPGIPDPGILTGLVIHTDLGKTGSFESSDPILNRLHEAAANSADYTVHGSVNDNPGAEKQNGLTPAISAGQGSVFFRDVEPLWRKVLADMRAVTPTDSMPPKGLGSGQRAPRNHASSSSVWSRQSVELPWYFRLHFGDAETMKDYYPFMKAYVDHFTKGFTNSGNLPGDEFGDHMDFHTAYGKPPPLTNRDGAPNAALKEVRYLTDSALVGAAYVIGMTRLTAQAAGFIGQPDEASHYSALADRMTSKFNEIWFIPERNAYGRRPPAQQFSIQGGNSLALYFDLVPTDKRRAVLDALVTDVKSWGGISTGMAATFPLLDVLARNGQAGLALKIFTQETYPGPGHSLTFGTKTLPEIWARPDGPSYASLVQSEYVGLARWFYSVLGGINPDPTAPGFKHFFLTPVFPEKLDSIGCRTSTPYGDIVSKWKQENGTIQWTVTIPWNTTASVQLAGFGNIVCNGKSIREADGRVEFPLDSGTWNLELRK